MRASGRICASALCAAVLVGCASEPQDPADERRSRLRERIEATFTPAQASCILDELDDADVSAIVATAELATDDEALDAYSAAVATCVTSD